MPHRFEALEERLALTTDLPGDVDASLADVQVVTTQEIRFEAEDLSYKSSGAPFEDGWVLTIKGSIGEFLNFGTAGSYSVTVAAYGTPLGGMGPELALIVDGVSIAAIEVDSTLLADYVFTLEVDAGIHEIRLGFINDDVSLTEDRNLFLDAVTFGIEADTWTPPVVVTKAEWQAVMQQREDDLLAETDALIDANRKGDATITVVDLHGNAIENASITVEQTSHSFLFGANLFMYERLPTPEQNAAYLQLFQDVFNYAAVPFYWGTIETAEGVRDYSYTDALVHWAVENGIQLKGHAPIWNFDTIWPDWIEGTPTLAQQSDFLTELMERYADAIDSWDVVNEAFHRDGIDYAALYTLADSIDPTGDLLLNEFGAFADGAENLYNFFQNVLGTFPVDGIGLQAHQPPFERFGMTQIWDVLTKYGALGQPIHISELSPTSDNAPFTGNGWDGFWTEAAQADYAERFYRTAFAHPDVVEISWWDFTDQGAIFPGGGMLRSDLTPKPVYNVIKNLITDVWHTSLLGSTGSSGGVNLRGFYGSYDVTVEWNGRVTSASFVLEEGTTNSWTIVLNTDADPLATAGGPYTVFEGLGVVIDASDSTSSVEGAVLSFAWDLNGDGDFSDASGPGQVLSWNTLRLLGMGDGPSTHAVYVRVSDQFGGSTIAEATIDVVNVAPIAAITGPSSAVRGESRAFTLLAQDPSLDDRAAGFTFSIDWNGDGTVDELVSGLSGTTVTHVFQREGSYDVKVTATDKDGAESSVATMSVTVSSWELRADASDPAKTDLIWGGTPGSDAYGFIPGFVVVQIEDNRFFVNPQLRFVGSFNGKLIVYGQGSSDLLFADVLSSSVIFFGGDGDDVLVGGRGADTIYGGAGNDIVFGGTLSVDLGDVLIGNAGDDFIVGHYGADSIDGGAGQDLIVAGTLFFAELPIAAYSIQSEWLASRPIEEKIANLTGTGGPGNNGQTFLVPGSTTLNDDAVDQVLGEADADWFIVDIDTDIALVVASDGDQLLDI